MCISIIEKTMQIKGPREVNLAVSQVMISSVLKSFHLESTFE